MSHSTIDRTLTRTDLVRVVRRIARQPGLWESLVDLTDGERHWARIEVPEGIDVWVISWPTAQSTDLHSHGQAAAAFTVVRGMVTEVRIVDGAPVSTLLPEESVQTVRPNEIHDVRNDREQGAVTIHAYAPSLAEMHFFSLGADGLRLERIVYSDQPEAEATW